MGAALLGLFVLSFAAILFVLYQIFVGGGQDTAPKATAKAPFAIPANARRFDSLGDFERAGRLPAGIPFAVTLTDAEINQRLQTELAKQPQAPFKDVKAHVQDGQVEFTGVARAAGVDLNSTVDIRFFPDNGNLGYDIVSINFGPVPVPGIARQAIADTIDKQLQTQKLTDQWVLDNIQMRPGAVTLVGHSK